MAHPPHDCGAHADDPSTSTGFLPLSLAIGLFVTGIFALGWVQCDPTHPADDGASAGSARP